MAYRIDSEFCAGCAHCIAACPFGAVEARGDALRTYYVILPEKCRSCGECARACPAALITFDGSDGSRPIARVQVDREKCIGCTLCKRACPVGAVSGVVKQPFEIDQSKCIHCGLCVKACRKDAILVEYADQ